MEESQEEPKGRNGRRKRSTIQKRADLPESLSLEDWNSPILRWVETLSSHGDVFFVHDIATIDRIVAEVKYDGFQFFALHSRVSPEQQDEALRPLPQPRKAVFLPISPRCVLLSRMFGSSWTMAKCICAERILYAMSLSVNKTINNGQVAQLVNVMAFFVYDKKPIFRFA